MKLLDAISGAGLFMANAAAQLRPSGPVQVGVVGELPGVPGKSQKRSTQGGEKALERAKLLRKYDRALLRLSTSQASSERSEILQRMKPILYELSPELRSWSGDARLRVHLLLQQIMRGIDDPSCAKASMGLLVLILSQGGRSALDMVRPMVRDRIVKMYDEPGYQSERFLPRVMLMLDDYNLELVEGVTKDAIHVWSEDRFKAAGGYLGFEELRSRGLRDRMKGLLGAEIATAGLKRDKEALNRAIDLYHSVS